MQHPEIVVRDLMTPTDRPDVIDLNDVQHVRVGYVAATLRRSNRQYVLVVDQDDLNRPRIRGIFSATQIARQLGLAVHAAGIATTFAELEVAIGR